MCTYPAAPAAADETAAVAATPVAATPAATPTPIATFVLVLNDVNLSGVGDGGGSLEFTVDFTIVFAVFITATTRYGLEMKQRRTH